MDEGGGEYISFVQIKPPHMGPLLFTYLLVGVCHCVHLILKQSLDTKCLQKWRKYICA